MKSNRYVFFYPSAHIGGAQLLFSKVAEALIKRGQNVLILKHDESCFMQNYLSEREMDFNAFKVSNTMKFHSEKYDIFVLSLSYIHLFKQFIEPHNDSRIVFWDLHPYALIEATALSKLHKEFPNSWLSFLAISIEKEFIRNIKAFVTEAHNNHAIYFMCYRNFKTNHELFGFNISPSYLPIPINVSSISVNNKNLLKTTVRTDFSSVIRIGWISRMDSDKVKILELLIQDVLKFNKRNHGLKIQLHAIGNGDSFKKVVKQIHMHGSSIFMPGILYGSELDKYIEENIDLGFSMGTAALEFASRRISTVLVPSTTLRKYFSKEPKRYLWLHDSHGFDVAVEKFHARKESKDFATIITEYYNLKEQSSEHSYNYVLQNHSFNIIIDNFCRLSNESTFTFAKFNATGIYKPNKLQQVLNKLKTSYKKTFNAK